MPAQELTHSVQTYISADFFIFSRQGLFPLLNKTFFVSRNAATPCSLFCWKHAGVDWLVVDWVYSYSNGSGVIAGSMSRSREGSGEACRRTRQADGHRERLESRAESSAVEQFPGST